MTNPYWDNGFAQLHQADARSLPLADESVDCVVTSPPYWGLRDYGIDEWEGGNEDCDHKDPAHRTRAGFNERWYGKQFQKDKQGSLHEPYRGLCGKCGAIRADGGIGLEPTPEEYCANMVEVFREVWRVLKPTGTLWLNLGDSYASDTKGSGGPSVKQLSNAGSRYEMSQRLIHGLKPKDLVGIPWRVAFALQADGWYLRSDIIWSKPNPMPESVTDRPTKAHEYVFLLTKSPRYYYDADAIREPAQDWGARDRSNNKTHSGLTGLAPHSGLTGAHDGEEGRNKRSVWEIATQPYPEAHFATFPEALVEPCILAGTSERGVCAKCGKPWERIVEKGEPVLNAWSKQGAAQYDDSIGGMRPAGLETGSTLKHIVPIATIGWNPTCDCNANTVPATVLDPFAGAGTTLAVAQRLGRHSVGTDLSPDYLALARRRLECITLPMRLT